MSYYVINEMSESERREFLAWYEGQMVEVLELYCLDDSGLWELLTRKNVKTAVITRDDRKNIRPYYN